MKRVSCSDTRAAHIIVPDGTAEIGAYAFMNCSALMWVDLPQSVSEIGEGAFSGCGTLNNIIIPDGVRTIKKDTFALCERMESALIPETVTQIGEHAFFNCQSLYRVSRPSRLDTLGRGRFRGAVLFGKWRSPRESPRSRAEGCRDRRGFQYPERGGILLGKRRRLYYEGSVVLRPLRPQDRRPGGPLVL